MMLLLLSNYYGNVRIDTDNAIYKEHFVDANGLTPPTMCLALAWLHTYISWMRKKKKTWKKGASNELQQKKGIQSFQKERRIWMKLIEFDHCFSALKKVRNYIISELLKNLEIVISFCISIKLPTFSMLDGRSKTWFEFWIAN